MITINNTDVSLGGEYNFIESQWTDGSYSDSSFIIYNSGTVGIGLSGPDASFVLDISGDIQFRGDISGSGAKLYNIPNEALDNSMITINGMDVFLGGSLEFIASQWTDGSYSDSSFIIYNSGTVGIGLSGPDASFVLDISGDIQFRGDISGSGAKLYNIPNEALDNSMITINGMDVSLGGSLEFIASQWTDGSYSDSSFIIYNSGTVGIGNGISGPDVSFALDVSGIVNCRELLIDGKAQYLGVIILNYMI